MSEDLFPKEGWRDKLKKKYRLVILNNDTFEQISSYRLSLQNIYITVSTLIVLLSLIIILFIVFTPVKRFIPGYGELDDNTQFIELNRNLDAIEENMDAQALYLESFRNMLTADENVTEESEEQTEIEENLMNNDIVSTATLDFSNLEKIKAEKLEKEKKVNLAKSHLHPPVTGFISASYMLEKKHYGVDVLAPKNTPIKAIDDGIVIMSGWNLETGNTIGIQHAENMVSFYKHNSAILKESGSYVNAGEAVAIIGNTGTLSDGPHLHFELWLNGNPVNPEDYIKFD